MYLTTVSMVTVDWNLSAGMPNIVNWTAFAVSRLSVYGRWSWTRCSLYRFNHSLKGPEVPHHAGQSFSYSALIFLTITIPASTVFCGVPDSEMPKALRLAFKG